MTIAFGTSVSAETSAFGAVSLATSLTGVTSGEPIIVVGFTHKYFSGSFMSACSDTFSTPYSWTFLINYTNSNYQTFVLIGTGGAGTSGTVTVSGANGGGSSGKNTFASMLAVPMTGASLASGTAIISASNYVDDSTGFVTSIAGPSISPTVSGCAALWVAGEYSGSITITPPGSPWTAVGSQSNGPEISAVGQINPATGTALNPTWGFSSNVLAMSRGEEESAPPPTSRGRCY
jgi:hypothetical protein